MNKITFIKFSFQNYFNVFKRYFKRYLAPFF